MNKNEKMFRCGSEMLEEYGLKICSVMAGVASVLLSKGQGVMSEELGKVEEAVCPKCSKISLYTDNHKVLKGK